MTFHRISWASLVAQMVKNLPVMQEFGSLDPWIRKITWRRQWLPTPILLAGEFHGQRSLVGYSTWGCKESDMTELFNHMKSLTPLSHKFRFKQYQEVAVHEVVGII